jgi:hypothetical protein
MARRDADENEVRARQVRMEERTRNELADQEAADAGGPLADALTPEREQAAVAALAAQALEQRSQDITSWADARRRAQEEGWLERQRALDAARAPQGGPQQDVSPSSPPEPNPGRSDDTSPPSPAPEYVTAGPGPAAPPPPPAPPTAGAAAGAVTAASPGIPYGYRNPYDRPSISLTAAEAEARYQAQMKRLGMLARADYARAIALITVVVAIVATPIYAMATSVDPESFSSYIAPVTGIAGAVVGYWFGAKSGDNADSPGGNALR